MLFQNFKNKMTIFSFKNTLLIMALALSALITNVDAQANCNTAADKQCCWVRKIHTGFGGYSQAIPVTGCCNKKGVACNGNGKVTEINWVGQSLQPDRFPLEQVRHLPSLTKM